MNVKTETLPAPGIAIKQHLDKLAQQLDIAYVLAGEKLTGRIADAWGCPVARWLRRRVRTAKDLRVLYNHVSFKRDMKGETTYRVPLPGALIGFVKEMDRGDYPQLVRE